MIYKECIRCIVAPKPLRVHSNDLVYLERKCCSSYVLTANLHLAIKFYFSITHSYRNILPGTTHFWNSNPMKPSISMNPLRTTIEPFVADYQEKRTLSSFPFTLSPTNCVKLPSLDGILSRLHLSKIANGRSRCKIEHPHDRKMRMPPLRSIIDPAVSFGTPQPHSCSLGKRPSSIFSVSTTSSPIDSQHSPHFEPFASTESPRLFANIQRAISPSKSTRRRASKYCRIEGCPRVSQRNNLCHSHGGKRLCKEDSCCSKDRGNGYCIKHGGGKLCTIFNCDKKARRKGLCTKHFRNMMEECDT